MSRSERFIEQARKDYMGTPEAIAFTTDACGEKHVVIRMSSGYYLDWIGAEYADQPDEWEGLPPDLKLIFKPIKETTA